MINTPSVDFHRLVVADNEQRPLYRGFPYTEKIRDNFSFTPQYPIQKFADGIYHKELLSDTIWKVDVDKYTPAYLLNFPEKEEIFSPADRENITNELFEQKTNRAEKFTGDYLITDQVIYFGLVGDDELRMGYQLLYSKKTGKILCGSVGAPLVTSRVGDHFNTDPLFVFQDTAFISVLQPQKMKETVKSLSEEDYNRLSTQDKQFMESIHAEDNPVLMVVKYKEF